MKKLNFAIIGCGRISYKHVEGLYENRKLANLAATCDVKLELAEAKAKEYLDKMNDNSLKVGVYEDYKEMLEKEGFEVSIWQSPVEKLMELPMEERRAAMGSIYAAKRPITDLTDNYDLIINLASVNPNTDQRIQWPASKGTPNIPFYIDEVPTIFVSVQCPFHLADVPQVQTYINAYDNKEVTLKALVDKMLGRSEFKGVSPVDAFCGFEDTRY